MLGPRGAEKPRDLHYFFNYFVPVDEPRGEGKAGTLIFSHDNVRERLSVETGIKAFNMVTPALPVVTFSAAVTFHLNGDIVHAFHIPRAHTDGDSVIHFQKANVIHTGDILFNGFYPFIDVDHGGSLKGMIAAADVILALANGDTKLIPGHGPLSDRAQLQAYRDMLATVYERLGKLQAKGMDAEAAVAAQPLADLEPRWGKGLFTGDKWVGLIYGGPD